MGAMNADELWTILQGLQQAVTAFDLKAKLCEFDGQTDEQENWERKKTNTRTKITKVRLLLALAINGQGEGLDWPDDTKRLEIIAKAQDLAECTRDQIIADSVLEAGLALFDLIDDLPRA
jgi:hypothetical protein